MLRSSGFNEGGYKVVHSGQEAIDVAKESGVSLYVEDPKNARIIQKRDGKLYPGRYVPSLRGNKAEGLLPDSRPLSGYTGAFSEAKGWVGAAVLTALGIFS